MSPRRPQKALSILDKYHINESKSTERDSITIVDDVDSTIDEKVVGALSFIFYQSQIVKFRNNYFFSRSYA